MVTRNNVVIISPYLNATGLTCDKANLFYLPVFPKLYPKRYRAVQKVVYYNAIILSI